jgi:hypothetical protein
MKDEGLNPSRPVMKISLLKCWDDGEPISIGLMHTPESWDAYNIQEVYIQIQKLWDNFKDTQPDSDNEFINYLKQYNFIEIFDPVLEVDLY